MSTVAAAPAVCRHLDGERWHFQHGPIDCIVAAAGAPAPVGAAIERAQARLRTLLEELVAELPLLRADLCARPMAPTPSGPVARRMFAACRPHADDGRFITAMAAVAGSVAEELLVAFDDPRIVRASVNNGGDIALRLLEGGRYDVGVCADPVRGRFGAPLDGRFAVHAASPVRGIATSGWRGRSFSLGIADSVTVLAATASVADAAATIVANAVDVDDARIVRVPADVLRDDSDLGERLVTRAVPPLPDALVATALGRGAAEARAQIAAGRIVAAVLSLQGRWSVVGDLAAAPPIARIEEESPC
jgi:ApbE superfamily uncharacterized protein (UPF0280 family)